MADLPEGPRPTCQLERDTVKAMLKLAWVMVKRLQMAKWWSQQEPNHLVHPQYETVQCVADAVDAGIELEELWWHVWGDGDPPERGDDGEVHYYVTYNADGSHWQPDEEKP